MPGSVFYTAVVTIEVNKILQTEQGQQIRGSTTLRSLGDGPEPRDAFIKAQEGISLPTELETKRVIEMAPQLVVPKVPS